MTAALALILVVATAAAIASGGLGPDGPGRPDDTDPNWWGWP